MKIDESGRWSFAHKIPPTLINFWVDENTCVCAYRENYDGRGPKMSVAKIEDAISQNLKIISLEEFIKIKEIGAQETNQIKEYFKDRKYLKHFWEELSKK